MGMKIYKINLCGSNLNYIKTLKFNSPISIKDLDKYFLKYKNLDCIACCNKKGLMVYDLYKDKTFNLYIYNKENEMIYLKWFDGRTSYLQGKEKYNEYMREKKKERLNKIINK